MQRLVTSRSRGQALIETAIALPVFLIAMFGVIWALQAGVLGERVQMAARYGGMVSAQGNAFDQYSLYTVYAASVGTPINAPCATPPPQMLSDGTPLTTPAPASPPFWQPSTGSTVVAGVCGRTAATAAALSGPKLLGHANLTIDATNDVPSFLQAAFGSATTPWNATVNELESPDMATLIACYPDLKSAFAGAVAMPATTGSTPGVGPIAQLQSASLGMDPSCTGG